MEAHPDFAGEGDEPTEKPPWETDDGFGGLGVPFLQGEPTEEEIAAYEEPPPPVQPKTFIVGVTQPDMDGILAYLEATDQVEFLEDLVAANAAHGSICLASMYAKMCYKSLVLGKNSNVSKIRSIKDNIKGTFKSGHGSVFEHVSVNFMTMNCSRIFSHQLVRHRVGTAYSQASGHYCTTEDLQMVLPPDMPEVVQYVYRKELEVIKNIIAQSRDAIGVPVMAMKERKWFTSHLRRLLPDGASQEMGWTMNVRALRNTLELRTHPANEWEIRKVFTDVGRMILSRWPLMLSGGWRVGNRYPPTSNESDFRQSDEDCARDKALGLDWWKGLGV